MDHHGLVGGAITILKNDGVRQWVADDIPYMKWKNKTCSKPPTSCMFLSLLDGFCEMFMMVYW